MSLHRRDRLLAAGLAGLLLAPRPAPAYERITHQHLVELAYAYIKLVKICEARQLALPQELVKWVEDCKRGKGLEFKDRPEGYTCGCVAERCEATCRNSTGIDKHDCVENCVEHGDGQSCRGREEGGGATAGGVTCQPPYYWVPAASDEIIRRTCGSECFEATTLASEECKVFAPVVTSGFLTAERAEQVFRFYQDFVATPCPPRSTEDEPGYQYHGQDKNCTKELTGTEARRRLADWTIAARGDGRVCTGPVTECAATCPDQEKDPAGYQRCIDCCIDYKPVVGHLLGATNAPDLGHLAEVDLSGTIVGHHSGVTDKLSDAYMAWRFFTLAEDALKLAAAIAVGAGAIALAALIGVGGILMCGLSCPVTGFFFDSCDDCFAGTFEAVEEVLESAVELIRTIEEKHLFGTDPSPAAPFDLGDVTSFFHFMDANLISTHDDVDGYQPLEAFGPGGYLVGSLYEGYMLDQYLDVRVIHPPSRRSLENYQPQRPDDGMGESKHRGLFYWQHQGFFDYTFPPVDNLAYYWWHKWLEGRANGKEATYGLLPLGAVLHAVQDITQPFHATGRSLHGHAAHESWVGKRLDPALIDCSKDVEAPSGEGRCEPILRLDQANEEQLFLDRVSEYVEEIRHEVLEPAGGVLHIRRLVHFLYERSVDAPTNLGLPSDGLASLASWVDLEVEAKTTREVSIPLAVAATVVVLTEGAAPDLSRYRAGLRLALEDFEPEGDVPPLTGGSVTLPSPVELTELPPEIALVYPEWVCAGAQPRAKAALEQYFSKLIGGRELLSILFAERTRCELAAAGLPVPGDAALDELGRFEAGRLEASLRVLAHGSLARLDGELACSAAAAPAGLLPPAEVARAAARCAGALDSDADGVPDQIDRCSTPRDLLARGLPVRPDGCVFEHEAEPLPLVNPFLPGTIRQEKP